mgnify:FL=1
MDEAVVRIILQDAARGSAPVPPGSATPPSSYTPPPPSTSAITLGRQAQDYPRGIITGILDIASEFRGAIGGLADTVVGAALDAIAKFRRVHNTTRSVFDTATKAKTSTVDMSAAGAKAAGAAEDNIGGGAEI